MPVICGFSKSMRWVVPCLAAFLSALFVIATASASELSINKSDKNLAIDGYDAVAYFTDSKATRGSSEHEVAWQDAHWYFSSAEHRKLFEADPSRYAPQFGGWCAAGVAKGEYFEVNPEVWTIVDGKLYLSYSRNIRDKWLEERSEKIAKAEHVWAERAKTN